MRGLYDREARQAPLFGEHTYPLEARFTSVSGLRVGNHNALSLEENMKRGRESIKGRRDKKAGADPSGK